MVVFLRVITGIVTPVERFHERTSADIPHTRKSTLHAKDWMDCNAMIFNKSLCFIRQKHSGSRIFLSCIVRKTATSGGLTSGVAKSSWEKNCSMPRYKVSPATMCPSTGRLVGWTATG